MKRLARIAVLLLVVFLVVGCSLFVKNPKEENVALGLTPTVSGSDFGPYGEGYKNLDRLTDGNSNYVLETSAGFQAALSSGMYLGFDFDLGQPRTITRVRVFGMGQCGCGTRVPDNGKIFGSANGTTWVDLNAKWDGTYDTNASGYSFQATLNPVAEYRYIRVQVFPRVDGFNLLTEVQIFAHAIK